MGNPSVYKLGYWSALCVLAAVSAFAVLMVLGFWLPTMMLSFAVCILLALSFVVMMAVIHQCAPEQHKIWSRLGATIAILYAVMVCITYYTQLAVVRFNSLQVSDETLKLFTYTPGSFLFAIDMLGYGFMCLSTLAAAPAFAGGGLKKWIRRFCVIHGALSLPTLIFPLLHFAQTDSAAASTDSFGNIALLFWCFIFAPIPAMLAVYFKRLLASVRITTR